VTTPEALIIGAGPAGAAAAIGLAQGGTRTMVLERLRETGDALCGGFLSWQSLDRLRALGLDPDALKGQKVGRVRLFAGKQHSETALPRPAIGVSRHCLDSALQAEAVRIGVALERGVHATALGPQQIHTRDGATLSANLLFLAAGKHGFRGEPRETAAWQKSDPVMGLRLRLPASAAMEHMVGDAVELHLFDRGYAGLVRQEDGSANLCLAVHKSRLDTVDGQPAALLRALGDELPRLGERLAHADWSQNIDAIGHVPYGWRTAETKDGLFRLGDQAGVIPSLAGEGMGIALASAADAVTAAQRGGPAAAPLFQRQLARKMVRPFALAGLVWRMGETPFTAGPMVRMAHHFPAMVQLIARTTRISGE
jgi:menaquinone-9 beta-reductase